MSAPLRIATFLLLLVAIGGGAALAGAAIDPSTETEERAGHGGEADEADGHGDATRANAHGAGDEAGGDHAAGAEHAPEGLAAADDGYRLVLDRDRYPRPAARAPLALRIVGPDGEAVRSFDVEHAKRMHVIVVRRDMQGFRHIHPRMAADGTWRVDVPLEQAGSYRVFADFSHDGTRRTLATDAHVAGRSDPRPLPAPARTARTASGLEVTLDAPPARAGEETELRFAVRDDGRRVPDDELGDYLGAKGHLVALRAGDLAYLHVHPDGDRLAFTGSYPSAGAYRLWVQFMYRGRVETAAFTQEVTR